MRFIDLGRREFIRLVGGAASAWPLAVVAQQGKIWRIGFIYPGSSNDGELGPIFLDDIRAELGKLGYIEHKNLIIDQRWGENQIDRLPALANELVALRPDAIIASVTPAIAAVQRATSTIPIVMSPATDPIGSGFVKSLSRPEGNITGLANLYGDQTAKSVEILHSLVPNAKQIAVLTSTNPTHARLYEVARTAANSIGLATILAFAATVADLDKAFRNIVESKCDALFVLADTYRAPVISLAAAAEIPAFYQVREYVELGGLASYGANIRLMFRQAAHYVDKILKGADPADLPVEQPTKFELVINLKTVKTLRLDIPPMLLAMADEVIE
jgi:putative tryptophan/tyrosine transport system substrate-binding protein